MSDQNQSENTLKKSLATAVWIALAVIATWLVVDLILALTGVSSFSGIFGNKSDSSADEPPASPSLLESGYWTIAGDDRPISMRQVDEVELARTLNTPPPAGSPPLKNAEALMAKLLPMIEGSNSTQQVIGEYMRSQLELPNVRMVLFTRTVADEQQLIAASAAMRGSDQWMLFETRAERSDQAIADRPEERPLLPLPENVTPIAVRHNNFGQRQAELSSGIVTSRQLLENWRGAGWTISVAPVAATGEAEHYLCSKADEAVYVWLRRQQGQLVVFMMASAPSAN